MIVVPLVSAEVTFHFSLSYLLRIHSAFCCTWRALTTACAPAVVCNKLQVGAVLYHHRSIPHLRALCDSKSHRHRREKMPSCKLPVDSGKLKQLPQFRVTVPQGKWERQKNYISCIIALLGILSCSKLSSWLCKLLECSVMRFLRKSLLLSAGSS